MEALGLQQEDVQDKDLEHTHISLSKVTYLPTHQVDRFVALFRKNLANLYRHNDARIM